MNILFLVHSTVHLWKEDKGQLVGGHSLCLSQWSRESNSCYTAWLSSRYLYPLNHLTLSTLFFKTRSFFSLGPGAERFGWTSLELQFEPPEGWKYSIRHHAWFKSLIYLNDNPEVY